MEEPRDTAKQIRRALVCMEGRAIGENKGGGEEAEQKGEKGMIKR